MTKEVDLGALWRIQHGRLAMNEHPHLPTIVRKQAIKAGPITPVAPVTKQRFESIVFLFREEQQSGRPPGETGAIGCLEPG